MEFYATCVSAQITSTQYNNEISKMGDTAHIRILPDFVDKDYYVGMELVSSDNAPTKVDLTIDQGKYFDENIEELVAQQSDMKLQEEYTKKIKNKMAVIVDKNVLAAIQTGAGLYNYGATAGVNTSSYDLGASGAPISINSENSVDKLLDLLAVLQERDVTKDGTWLLIPSWFARKLKSSDLKMANEMGDSTSTIRTGLIGKLDGIEVWESNNMTSVTDGTTAETCWYALAGHKSAIAFASTFELFRVVAPTNRVSKQLQMVNVWGRKVVQDKFLASLYCTIAA
jgi:hypothetical protein